MPICVKESVLAYHQLIEINLDQMSEENLVRLIYMEPRASSGIVDNLSDVYCTALMILEIMTNKVLFLLLSLCLCPFDLVLML